MAFLNQIQLVPVEIHSFIIGSAGDTWGLKLTKPKTKDPNEL